MKINRDQYNKINEGCENGFTLDLFQCVAWGVKRLSKEVEIENGERIRVDLDFNEVTENGKSYSKKLGVKPVYIVSKLYPTHTENMYRVYREKSADLGEMIPRRNMKKLQELSKLDIFTDAAILANYAK